MARSFGDVDPNATKAINRLCQSTDRVHWTPHSLLEMDNDDFDHTDVLTCLRRGTAHGPEHVRGQMRYNVLHRGLHIRVVVGMPMGLEIDAHVRLVVVTVMRMKE